jgi:hypothetical protein
VSVVADLRALREKYETMLALRVAHARAKDDPSFIEPDPRPAMRELAARFPGALREIDELPLETIEWRIAALSEAVRDHRSHLRPWMSAQIVFHRLARGALATKRWLGRRRTIVPLHREAFLEAIDNREIALEALAWEDDLAHVARPPRGRLMDLVLSRAAKELALDVPSLRALLYPHPKRR